MKNGLPQRMEDVRQCLDSYVVRDAGDRVLKQIVGTEPGGVYIRTKGSTQLLFISFGELHLNYERAT